ncbi:mitochondrial 54S ribosomal protein bL27m [Lipomyces oligophaga]|uniref:mitochondrial 54S ribosomal protein bL27m n=1 Tax=Lipomyces oligophaga TaxID=45792 RepID=UPI0034CF424F
MSFVKSALSCLNRAPSAALARTAPAVSIILADVRNTIGIIQKSSSKSIGPLQFVRYATKRASSTRTNDENSSGRRLGLKVAEGGFVLPGSIIFRQRGTKWYPGENTTLGKNYNIHAKEPGFVRYYRDPFHPKRKFIGVALSRDSRLPSPHWEPRDRRFGRYAIQDVLEADKERKRLSRKEYYGWIEKTKQYNDRVAKREVKSASAESDSQ